MVRRRCTFEMPDGRRCAAPPGRDAALCFWHDPGKADELAEARRLGGIRRKRERTIAAAYEFTGLDSVVAIRRVLEVATTDVLGLDNSIARSRVLISAALAAAKLVETGELEERLAALEAAIQAGERHAGGRDESLLEAAEP